jgi:DNA-binding CsgD family transcriptional regulator
VTSDEMKRNCKPRAAGSEPSHPPPKSLIEELEQQSRLLSIAEVSDIVGCHPKTLYGRLRRGDLKSIRDAGKLKIDTRELASYLRKRELAGIPALPRNNRAKQAQNTFKATAPNGAQTQQEVPGKDDAEEYRVALGPLTLIIPARELTLVAKDKKLEQKDDEQLSTLTLREREVYQYLEARKRPKDIAGLLDISTSTVRSHIRNIYGKLNVHSQVELITIYHTTT